MTRGSPGTIVQPGAASGPNGAAARRPFPGGLAPAKSQERHSHGLEQFFASIQDREGLSVVDLAGASQATVDLITALGHRLYADDFIYGLERAFGGGDFYANQEDAARVSRFLSQTLDFPSLKFDGALVWDSLQFLTPPLQNLVVDRLYEILRPQSCLLAFFQAEEKAQEVPVYSFRVMGPKTVALAPRGGRLAAQFFNNRSLEKLFRRFGSVKFFLTRDHLREVIVRR